MNWFKKKFCKHDYKYYHTEDKMLFPDVSSWKSPCYVCVKCGKSDYIYGGYLYDVIKKAKNEKNKMITLNQDITKYDNYKLEIGDLYKLEGFVAFYVANYIGKLESSLYNNSV